MTLNGDPLLPFEIVPHTQQVVLAIELPLNRAVRSALIERMGGVKKVLDIEVQTQFPVNLIGAAEIHGRAFRVINITAPVSTDGKRVCGNGISREPQAQSILLVEYRCIPS